MIYDIIHRTEYVHEWPVSAAHRAFRMLPRATRDQRVISASIATTPAPDSRREYVDGFGNDVVVAQYRAAHSRLGVELRARIEVDRREPPASALTPPWEAAREAAWNIASLAAESPAQFIFESRNIRFATDMTEYARASFGAGAPVLEGAIDLMRRIHTDFAYEPGATDVATPVAEAFKARRGVCQDFAHVMIAALRGLGLPAAYVSGYLRTIPPPGQPRLEGADASHAWAAIWCAPEVGWVQLDPTNALVVGNDHIVVAMGRDYADVSPIDGVMLGAGRQKLDVRVDVIPAR